ncbi:MAG: 2'-deoxycytidine 5'-triphosphate deaminase, partial [Candidatus Nanoarchaeia archaeon]
MKSGVLPDWRIKELIEKGVIKNADPELVSTSGLDLRVGSDQWKLVGSFLPLPGQSIEEALGSSEIVDHHSHESKFYVEHLQQYALKLEESLALTSTIRARIFNKSGRGRIGVSLRGMTDGTTKFDKIDNGYVGNLYIEISSTCFPLTIHAGETAFPQVRFYEGNPQPIAGSDLEILLRDHPILTDDAGNPSYDTKEKTDMVRTGELTFTADIPQGGLVAYRALRDRRTLDLAKKDHYDPEKYFEGIHKKNGERLV